MKEVKCVNRISTVLVLVALAITCTVYWCSADDDCTKRGGVLVQAPGTWGGYACVAKKR